MSLTARLTENSVFHVDSCLSQSKTPPENRVVFVGPFDAPVTDALASVDPGIANEDIERVKGEPTSTSLG